MHFPKTAIFLSAALALGGCAADSGPKENSGTVLGAVSGALIGSAIGGAAVLRVLRRFQLRFAFTYAPAPFGAAQHALPPVGAIEVQP